MIKNGIEFLEAAQEPKSPTQSFNLDGGRTVRTWRSRINTEDERFRAVVELMGYPYAFTQVAAGAGPNGTDAFRRALSRVPPDAYPGVQHAILNLDGRPHMYCTEVPKVEPYGRPIGTDEAGRAVYDWKVLEAHYNTLPYLVKADDDPVLLPVTGPLSAGGEILDDAGNVIPIAGWAALPDEGDALARGWIYSRYISRHREYAPKTITIKRGMPHFVETSAAKGSRPAINEGLGFPQFRMRVTYTHHQVPLDCIPERAMVNLANYVNDAPFDFAPTGTLLYVSTKEKPTPGPLGDVGRVVDLEHQFLFMPNVDTLTDPATGKVTRTPRGPNAVPRVVGKKIAWWPISTDGDPANIDAAKKDRNDYLIFKYGDLRALFRPDQVP